MKDYKLSIEAFTVSFSMDTYSNGNKSSHFVSASVKSEPAVEPEDFAIVQLDAAMRVTGAVFQDAVARMHMTPNEAKDRLTEIRANFDSIREKALEARAKKAQEPTEPR